MHVPENKISSFIDKNIKDIKEMLDLHRKTDEFQTQVFTKNVEIIYFFLKGALH